MPASQVWTEIGRTSLGKHEATFQSSSIESPAAIAIPFQMQGIGDLLALRTHALEDRV